LERLRDNKKKEIEEYLEKLISNRGNFYSGYIDRVRKDLEQSYEEREKELEEQINNLQNSGDDLESALENLKKEVRDKLVSIKEDLEKQLTHVLDQYNAKIKEYVNSNVEGNKNAELLKEAGELQKQAEEINTQIANINNYLEELAIKPKSETMEEVITADNYIESIKDYQRSLESYNADLDFLYKLEQKYLNGDIEYSEYKLHADYVVERYNYLKDLYEKLSKFNDPYLKLSNEDLLEALKKLEADFVSEYQFRAYEQNGTEQDADNFIEEYNSKKKLIEDELNRRNNPYLKLSDEELLEALKKLEADFVSEYQFRAYEQNGTEQNTDNFIEEYRAKKKLIEDELNRRKNKGNNLVPPMPPRVILEKKKVEPEPEIEDIRTLDARKIMLLLKGKDNDYKLGDNFAMKYKNVKIWGWKKYKERTILDKPIRLTKVGVGGIIKAPLKFFANLSYMSKKKRLELLQERINKLSPEQLDALIDYGISELKAFRPAEVIMTALLPRLNERLNERLIINNNIMAKMRTQIVDLYIKAQAILNKLNSEQLSIEERKSLETEFKTLSDQLFDLVIKVEKIKNGTDELVNPARLGDSFAISKNLRDGGFYSKNLINHDVDTVDLVFGDRIENAKAEKDGFALAEALISRDKLDKENTVVKRTLRNKFGKTSVGSRYFSPFVEMEDYEKNPYFSNLMQTAVLAMTVCNVVNQINLQKELDTYKDIITHQNQTIQNFQAKYSILENQALAALDPSAQQAFANDLRALAETQAGYIQGICEDFAQKSAAGVLGKNNPIINSNIPEYHNLDKLAHDTTGKFISDIQGVSTTLSPMDQVNQINTILEDMNTFMADFTAKSFPGVGTYMATKSGFDFTAQQVFAQSITKANPALAVDLQYKLLDMAQGIVDLPTLTTIQNLTANADVAGALTVLCGVLGKEVVEEQLKSSLTEGKFASPAELTNEYAEKLDSVKTQEEIEAERRYNENLEKFDSQGKIRKWLDRKNKPTKASSYREIIDEEADEIYERGLRYV